MGGTLTRDQKDDFCINQMSILYQFNSPYWHSWMDVILFISGLINMAIAFQVIYHKHLRSHPAPLIAALCISESCFLFMGVSRYFVCSQGGHFEGMAAATIFFDTSEESQLRVMKIVSQFFTFISTFAFNFTTVIDIAL